MKVLISPTTLAEARIAADGGADIIDIKNVEEGSLGANFPWVIRQIVSAIDRGGVSFSATLGDLPFKPGTAALAALGAVECGAQYIKAGLHGIKNHDQALALMRAVRRTCRERGHDVVVVAAGYADWGRIGSIDPSTLVRAAADAGADLVMVDTAIKDGAGLFDLMCHEDVHGFVSDAHEAGLEVALAGALKLADVPRLRELGPDVVGVRGCVCRRGDRGAQMDLELVREFVRAVKD